MPSDRRAKLRKKYGDLHGISLDFKDPAEAVKGPNAKQEDSDSDLEILREEEAAAEEKKLKEKLLKEIQQAQAGRGRGRGPIAPEDWQNRQLLARVKARYQPKNPSQEEEEEEEFTEEEEELEESPLAARRVQHPPPEVALSPTEDQFNSDKEDTPLPSSSKRKNTLMVVVKDKDGHECKARIRKGDALQKLFGAFEKTAKEKVSKGR